MGVIAEGILRGCQGLFIPVSLGYPLSVFNKKLYSQGATLTTQRQLEHLFRSTGSIALFCLFSQRAHNMHDDLGPPSNGNAP